MERDDRDERADRRFRIWVEGRLNPRFSEGLDGVEQEDIADGTRLSGALIDHSQLHGILDRLRALGIAVRRFEVEK